MKPKLVHGTTEPPSRPIYPYPLFVYFNMHCNYACSYCFTASGPTLERNSYLLAHWPVVLEQARRLGVPEIRLSGGEPLLVPEIHRRCRQVVESDMSYTITTNGSQLARHLPWLVDLPPATIWISYHDEYSTPNRFVENVALATRGLPSVGINVFSRDVDRYESLLSLCAEAGATRFKILHLTPIGRERAGAEDGALRKSDARRLARSLEVAAGRRVEVRVEAPVLVGEPAGPQTCALRSRPLLSVAQDGLVYPCCVTLGLEGCAVGDLRSQSLAEIVARAHSLSTLPCCQALPRVAAGQAPCPLVLVPVH